MASGPDPAGRSRFAKLGMAINEEMTQACRDVLEMEVPPGLVYNKVKASSIYKKMRPEQELCLKGAKSDGYKEFDITLLYTLIRNICTKIPPPTNGWGGNSMPSVGETTIGDDIERIRLIRNTMFGHISSASTTQEAFDDTWSSITDICQRLQTYTNKDYLSGLSKIQRLALEEENEKAIIEKLEADYERNIDLMEKMSSLEMHSQGKPMINEILKDWQEENTAFTPTKASGVVEEKLKSHNLVIVVGNSGSGKSAIIQHIALKYKDRGGYVIPVDEVREIKEKYSYSAKNKILFVLNDPLGKESLDEILYTFWKKYQKTIETCLKKVKLLVSCRRCVYYDNRVKGLLFEESNIVEIDNEENRLTDVEKRAILNQYKQNLDLPEEIVFDIIKTEAYFPLLCKLFSRSNYKENGLDFFKSPKKFIKEEIEIWKKKDKKKFCALILVVAFKNNLKIETIVRNDDSKKKYKDILGMCELPENTHISAFRSTFQELKGSYVKCVGHVFQFLHDFIMEITTLVFGVDCPQETIQYADSGFLRRRVRIEDDTEEGDHDPFTVYLPEEYIGDLVERFINDMQTEHFVDVVLNQCLRNENVKKQFLDSIKSSENLLSNIDINMKFSIHKSEFVKPSTEFSISRLIFLDWRREICPLIGFIVFGHDDISLSFIRSINKKSLLNRLVFSAVCANGAMQLFHSLSQEYKETALNEIWGLFYPIHIASVFHNFELIPELIRLGANVNMLCAGNIWTPLILAAGNDEEHLREAGKETQKGVRRNKTIACLLNYGAKINLGGEDGKPPLCLACQKGYTSTVQLLLHNGAKINLCDMDGTSPIFIACQNGHKITVQLLLDNGANINLCKKNGASPLYTACQNGHDSTVQLLLNNDADINLCNSDGLSPLCIACQNGHNATVQLLLDNHADINLCDKDGSSPLWVACQNGHYSTVQLLLNKVVDINLCEKNGASPLYIACQNGHGSTVQLLLNNGADIKLCNKNGASPFYIACQNGHDSTVQLLLNNGADINQCRNNKDNPLYKACETGRYSTVQLLLNNGAKINLYNKNGASPLYIACQNGYDSMVQLLLNNGADINLCNKNGASPLYIACQSRHESTVQLLLNNFADINLCEKNGASPLYIACYNGHDSTVQLLLNNGAEINLCEKNGASPLYIACYNGHDSTVKLLRNNGADINLCDNDGFSPLYI